MSTTEQLDFFFGNLLRLMGEAKLSKRRLAAEIGVPERVVNDMVARRAAPTLEMVYGIADALKVDVADLLQGQGVHPRAPVQERDKRHQHHGAHGFSHRRIAARINP